jgi:2-polyprenyl-6-methoxyphenol hydroxylase-like FAD-dependent oxidoreductase
MTPRLIIVGGGIGGLTAALALRRIGWDVVLHEQAAVFTEIGAGMSLWPNATRILRSLGLLDAVLARARLASRFQLLRADGRRLATLSLEGFPTPALFIHRADLHRLLVAALPPSILINRRRLLDFSQDARSVTAHFADGSAIHGDGLIGADGIHSTVRTRLHGSRPPCYRGYQIWRGIAPEVPGIAPDQISESWGRGQRFGILPLGQGRICWYATRTGRAGAPDAPEGRKSEVTRLFRDWHCPIPALVAATDSTGLLKGDACDRDGLAIWGDRRVTLLGDAAHPITPNVGQGAGLAIEDAAVLAKCLQADPHLPTAFRRYETLRRRRTAFIGRWSRRVGTLGQWRNPLVVAARNGAARIVLGCTDKLSRIPMYSYEV